MPHAAENPATDPTKRFGSRVDNYVKYRPHYPRAIVDILEKGCGLQKDWVVADIGSGTGFLTEVFLRNGNRCFGIEPNQAMRQAGEKMLRSYATFHSMNATAENTKLDPQSIDLITAGQAFHWFDATQAKQEFLRIVKPRGYVALVWNERRLNGSLFMHEYHEMLLRWTRDYRNSCHKNNVSDASLQDFFSPKSYSVESCENSQFFGFEELKGRLLSSSYSPEPEDPQHGNLMSALESLFQKHEKDGQVKFQYDTRVYYGRLVPE